MEQNIINAMLYILGCITGGSVALLAVKLAVKYKIYNWGEDA